MMRVDNPLTFVFRGARQTRKGERPDYPVASDFLLSWWREEEFHSEIALRWASVFADGSEVARFAVMPRDTLSSRLGIRPDPQRELLEIVFLEVAAPRRRSKIGSRVIVEIQRQHAGERLMAISEDSKSDAFWGSLGWRRHVDSVLTGTRAVYVAE